MKELLFPIKLDLTILQLEEYQYLRFVSWIARHFFVRHISLKKSLVYTFKIKQIIFIYSLLGVGLFGLIAFFSQSILLSLIFCLVWITQPYIGLGVALLLIKPYEIINRYLVIERTRKKVLSMKNLKVIAVTGSYGKTSTKEILYQLLKGKFKVLRTPESYNTVFGIAKVVDLELDKIYDYFICEMAAYTPGEIKTLCYMVPPTYGIITGITSQHLERFKSLTNIIKAKFELFDAVGDKNNLVINTDNDHIKEELEKRKQKIKGLIKTSDVNFKRGVMAFSISDGEKKYKTQTQLFGTSQIKNIALASTMANKLGVPLEQIAKKIPKITPFSSRAVLRKFENGYLVDNTYSSNIESFKENVETAKLLSGSKAIVTPGIVELGRDGVRIHEVLGEVSQHSFDHAVLVGKNERTKAFAKKFGENKCSFINDNREEYFETIQKLKEKYSWIFLENDVTENY